VWQLNTIDTGGNVSPYYTDPPTTLFKICYSSFV